MPISSPGIGSGLDVNSIVTQLVALERRPIEQLQAAKTKLSTQLSSVGLLQSYMGNVQSIAGILAKAETWTKSVASSGDSTAVGATALASATPATYSIEVITLAAAQSLSTAAGAITDASNMGAGTLTITRGATATPIAIAGGTSLAAVRDQVNAAKAGVTAAIIQDTGGPRLVFTASDSGLANTVTVAVTGAAGQLNALSFPGGMTQNRAAADASVRINGLLIGSPKNKLTGVVDGLDLNLLRATTAPVQITVGHDTASMKKNIADFVSAFNEIGKYLATQTKFDAASRPRPARPSRRKAV